FCLERQPRSYPFRDAPSLEQFSSGSRRFSPLRKFPRPRRDGLQLVSNKNRRVRKARTVCYLALILALRRNSPTDFGNPRIQSTDSTQRGHRTSHRTAANLLCFFKVEDKF